MGNEKYQDWIQKTRIPIVILDQKWHQIFLVHGKTDEIEAKEKELADLLAKQGKLNTEMRDLKKVKQKLMDDIVQNTDERGTVDQKKAEDNKRLIGEVNEKLESLEDALLELPRQIKEVNDALMLLTMDYCYDTFRLNEQEIKDITAWITQVRHDLKVNVVKKQNREINTRQIYSYLNDVFGPDVVNMFDLQNSDIQFRFHEEEKKKEETGK